MEPWNQFLSLLEAELGKPTVDKWLRSLVPLRFDAANLYLQAQNNFQIDWFEEHIRPRIRSKFFNNNQRPIRVHLSLPTETPPQNKFSIPRKEPPSFLISPDPIDPEMTLKNFIPLPQNQVAFQVFTEIEKSPFNPLFLYGPKNSGKTHLLMSAAKFLQQKGKRVFFVRAESFTEHVVQAIRLGLMQEFRKIYREIDALIIDDVHIFSRKNATQEELFHTFNALHTHLQTIILSANRAPSLLEEIEPRLISRFEWGLTLSLNPISPEMILEKKGALWNFPLSSELIHYLTEKFPLDPLLALQALTLRAKGIPHLTPQLAEPLLRDLLEQEAKNSWTMERIVKKMAEHYGVRTEDLMGKSQTKESAAPRQLAMYLCRKKLKLPYQKIGDFFDRDHSTVMTSVKQIEKGLESNERDLVEAVEKFRAILDEKFSSY